MLGSGPGEGAQPGLRIPHTSCLFPSPPHLREGPSPLSDVQAGSKPTHPWPPLLPCPMSTPWVSPVGHALQSNRGDFWSFATSLYQFTCESSEDLPKPIKTVFPRSSYSLRLALSVFSDFAHAVPHLEFPPLPFHLSGNLRTQFKYSILCEIFPDPWPSPHCDAGQINHFFLCVTEHCKLETSH